MIVASHRKHVSTVQTHTITLQGRDVVAMLRRDGHDIPEKAVVTVTVPGGGDWSNMALNLDDADQPIEITWETREEKVT